MKICKTTMEKAQSNFVKVLDIINEDREEAKSRSIKLLDIISKNLLN
jgi:hypothetical protein